MSERTPAASASGVHSAITTLLDSLVEWRENGEQERKIKLTRGEIIFFFVRKGTGIMGILDQDNWG